MAEKRTQNTDEQQDATVTQLPVESHENDEQDVVRGDEQPEARGRSLPGAKMTFPALVSLPGVVVDGHHNGHAAVREQAARALVDSGHWHDESATQVTASAEVLRGWLDDDGVLVFDGKSGGRAVSLVTLPRALGTL